MSAVAQERKIEAGFPRDDPEINLDQDAFQGDFGDEQSPGCIEKILEKPWLLITIGVVTLVALFILLWACGVFSFTEKKPDAPADPPVHLTSRSIQDPVPALPGIEAVKNKKYHVHTGQGYCRWVNYSDVEVSRISCPGGSPEFIIKSTPKETNWQVAKEMLTLGFKSRDDPVLLWKIEPVVKAIDNFKVELKYTLKDPCDEEQKKKLNKRGPGLRKYLYINDPIGRELLLEMLQHHDVVDKENALAHSQQEEFYCCFYGRVRHTNNLGDRGGKLGQRANQYATYLGEHRFRIGRKEVTINQICEPWRARRRHKKGAWSELYCVTLDLKGSCNNLMLFTGGGCKDFLKFCLEKGVTFENNWFAEKGLKSDKEAAQKFWNASDERHGRRCYVVEDGKKRYKEKDQNGITVRPTL